MVLLLRYALTLHSALLAVAVVSERLIADEDVLLSLSPSITHWGHNVRSNNFSYCKEVYAEDASLLAQLGPAAAAMRENTGLESPSLNRGRDAIENFWRTFAGGISDGLNNLRVYESEGPYARITLVVDDNTAIITSPFALPELRGRVLSSTWVRSAIGSWEIKSDMLQIENSDLQFPTPAPKTAQPLVTRAPIVQSTWPEKPLPVATTPAPFSNSTEMGALVADGERAGHALVWVLASVAAALGAFYIIRANRRRAAMRTIGGPDTLLG